MPPGSRRPDAPTSFRRAVRTHRSPAATADAGPGVRTPGRRRRGRPRPSSGSPRASNRSSTARNASTRRPAARWSSSVVIGRRKTGSLWASSACDARARRRADLEVEPALRGVTGVERGRQAPRSAGRGMALPDVGEPHVSDGWKTSSVPPVRCSRPSASISQPETAASASSTCGLLRHQALLAGHARRRHRPEGQGSAVRRVACRNRVAASRTVRVAVRAERDVRPRPLDHRGAADRDERPCRAGEVPRRGWLRGCVRA